MTRRRSRTPRWPCSTRSSRPTRPTTCGASTTGTSASTAWPPDSATETYAAMRLEIENWRWSGVPFFIRTGKRLPVTQTELRAHLQASAAAGLRVAWDRTTGAEPGRRQAGPVDRHQGDPGRPANATSRRSGGSTWTWSSPSRAVRAPRRTRCSCTPRWCGDSTRFTRQDGVEETWRVMQPLLDAPPPVHAYAPGSWGPSEADRLTAEYGGWHQPVGRRHEPTREPRRARRHPPRSRPSPTTRSCPTATPAP